MLAFVGVSVGVPAAGSRLGLPGMPGLPGASAVIVGFLRAGDSPVLIGLAAPLGLEWVVPARLGLRVKALWLLFTTIRPVPGPAVAPGRPFDLSPRSVVARAFLPFVGGCHDVTDNKRKKEEKKKVMSFYLRAGGACFLYIHCQALPEQSHFCFQQYAAQRQTAHCPPARCCSGEVLIRHTAVRHRAVVSKHAPV